MTSLPADAIAIYNYEYNGLWAWVSTDDIFIRRLTLAEEDAVLDYYSSTIAPLEVPATPARIRRFL